MDFGNAVLVSALLFGLVMWEKKAFPAIEASSLLTILSVIVSAQVAIWLLRYTVWAHEQVVGGHPLDTLNFGSLVAAGLFLALGATVVDQGVKMVKNVGENQVDKPVAK